MTPRRDGPAAGASPARNGSAPRECRSDSLGELYRVAREYRGNGELYTTRVSDPLGSWVAAVAIRLHIHPTVVTLTDLGLAITASTVVITQADQLHPGWAPGLIALLFWQLVYILDCADGQIARATGKTSSFAARVDILVDFLVQIMIVLRTHDRSHSAGQSASRSRRIWCSRLATGAPALRTSPE
ncbi:MAG: CDP-alcohol phosphatidyltransferase family protein [Actinobacteria bacterium]|nr:CDP-alcohol phosphatidyltransferase family protein [Actinomycetota bacterium]